MWRSKVVVFPFVLVLLLSATGCNLIAKYDLARAQRLESQGKFQEAIKFYSKALADLPESKNKQRSDVYLHLGDCWLHVGNPGEAFTDYQQSTVADPSNMAAHLRLGEMYLAGGAAERASEQAQNVLAAASANPEGLALLGAASSAAGDTELALQAFETVLKAEPQRVRVAVALADLYNRRDETDKAREVLKRANAAQPASSQPLLALGRLEEQEGNSSAAENAYRSAVTAEDSVETNTRLASFLARTSRPDEAVAVLTHADSLNHRLPVGRADFKLLTGDAAAALDEYTDVLNSPAFDQSSQSKWLPSSLAGHISAVADANRAQMVVRVIEADLQIAASAAASDPSMVPVASVARFHFSQYAQEFDPATAQIVQAEISLAENDLTDAAEHGQRAIELAPESAAARYVRGLAMYRKGDLGSARAEWTRALQQDDAYVPARLALAEDAMVTGNYLQAEEYVVPVVRDEPENLRALNLFSSTLFAQKRYASAELIARRALMMNPADSEAHILLAKIAVGQEHLATALYEYEKAISLEPRSEQAMEGLFGLYSQGRITKPMLQKLERVAETPPSSASLMEMTARLYSRRGWTGDAERCFRRAIQIDPYRVTALESLAQFKASRGEEQAALDLGARKGGPDAALLRAVRAERQQDLAAAASEYESAIRQGERSGIAANNLAWLLAADGRDLDRALSMAERAHSLAPDSAAILDTLGFVHIRRREYSAAIPVLREAAQLAVRSGSKTEEAAIQGHLSEAYVRSGQQAEQH